MRFQWFYPIRRGEKPALRKSLRRIGPTWAMSPWRRVVQAVAFVAFLWLFLYVAWPYTTSPPTAPSEEWPSHYADEFTDKETLPAETFLALDPLVSVSTSIASRALVWSLAVAGGMLLVSLVVPRGFCGYLCPLGTLIDLFDWSAGRLSPKLPRSRDGYWNYSKFAVLGAVLVAALFGVVLTGYVAAIPTVTRAFAFLVSPLQLLAARWSPHQLPPFDGGKVFSVVLLLIVFGLGLMRPRFWCRYLCPSGALFSITNLFRLTERKVRTGCVSCGRCREVCPFDAIEEDFSTRVLECTYCQTCGGACPVNVIEFAPRWDGEHVKPENAPKTRASRRRFLTTGSSMAVGGVVGVGLAPMLHTIGGTSPDEEPVVRPPGSVPERDFLALCVRCGECFQACPNNVLQPIDLSGGVEGMWTPRAALDWSGCDPSCNICGRVCPTSAIRPLPLDEKRVARMGLAEVNKATCLPHAGVEACQICVDECRLAGYNAIEFRRVRKGADGQDAPPPVASETSASEEPVGGFGLMSLDDLGSEDEGVGGSLDGLSLGGESMGDPPIGLGMSDGEEGLPDDGFGAGFADETLGVAPPEGEEAIVAGEAVEEFLVPFVLADKCVGCGLCQSRCYHAYADTGRMTEAAIIVRAGEGKEDRLTSGSYKALREAERDARRKDNDDGGFVLPEGI